MAHDVPGRLPARDGGRDVRFDEHSHDGVARRARGRRDAEDGEHERWKQERLERRPEARADAREPADLQAERGLCCKNREA